MRWKHVGKAGAGCDPTYQKVAIAAAQKEWKLGSWEVPLEMCYSELENTIAQYCLKTGTEIADPYFNGVHGWDCSSKAARGYDENALAFYVVW